MKTCFSRARASKICLYIFSILVYTLVIVGFIQCNKSEEYRFDTSYNKALTQDVLMADLNYRNVFYMIYKLSLDTSLLRKGSGFLDSAWVMQNGGIWVLAFDSTRRVPDGSIRSGQIQLDWTAPLTDTGSVANVRLHKYRVNGKNISGSLKIYQLSINVLKFKMDIDSGIIRMKGQVRYNGSFILRRSSGASTQYTWGDDIFRILGNAEGRGAENDRFRYSTTDTLTWRFPCRYLSGGGGLIEMPDFEINRIEIEYAKVNECSGAVSVTYQSKPANGAIRKIKTETLSINF